ncbi:MAG: Asp-tRNA(Asn)/Glu-tRNA(Gln) amidotransferase GatCAB subunit C, partial [Candidatus Methanomethylophilaceae archaeon]|nr:Asp-tRNA(Asn)/Glu-tRNA(Gln) amidotransferase GatCAB subunit C [Candidatus Methanomethylophilaceae archaeon]
VAKFAHIALTDEEAERYCKDLGDILSYFELLNEAPECDERGVNPILVEDITREDVPKVEYDAEFLLRDMDTYERYVRGPRLS